MSRGRFAQASGECKAKENREIHRYRDPALPVRAARKCARQEFSNGLLGMIRLERPGKAGIGNVEKCIRLNRRRRLGGTPDEPACGASSRVSYRWNDFANFI